MDDDTIVEEVEKRFLASKRDLFKGDRVVIVLDDVIPIGTCGTVAFDYSVKGEGNAPLRVLVDKCSRPDGWKNSGNSIWYLNRWQVERITE